MTAHTKPETKPGALALAYLRAEIEALTPMWGHRRQIAGTPHERHLDDARFAEADLRALLARAEDAGAERDLHYAELLIVRANRDELAGALTAWKGAAK